MSRARCVFCRILAGEVTAPVVFEGEQVVAFLDHRPLLPGHLLVVPRRHVETLPDLPQTLLAPLFGTVQLLARAVETGLGADGSFTAVNTRVSQSVPHLHVHVVPRREKDGLFSPKMVWKRRPYREGQAEEIAARLRRAVGELEGAAEEGAVAEGG